MSDVGCRREVNEDSYLILPKNNLWIVADGMGGHAGGEFASAIAVNTVEEVLTTIEIRPDEEDFDPGAEANPVELVREKLRYSIRLAGKRIHERAQIDSEYQGMGTTCLALIVDGGNAFMAHVGDSRGYLIRDGKIEQLTEDHSLVNERVRAGLITEEEAKNHKLKNIITRSLGFMEDVEIDLSVRAVRRGDYFLLCSDGLSNFMEADEMGECVLDLGPQDSARRMIETACERGGDDNITVVVVRIDEAA